MRALFPDLPEALENTVRASPTAARSNLSSATTICPPFTPPDGSDTRTISAAGAMRATPMTALPGCPAGYRERLEYELSVIDQWATDYFLIVADFVGLRQGARHPGRAGTRQRRGRLGAPTASRITDVDPVKYDLLFERCLNPERVSMPDFDIDFCDAPPRRGHRLRDGKYGSDHRRADHHLRHPGRPRRHPRRRPRVGDAYAQVDEIAKLIPRRCI